MQEDVYLRGVYKGDAQAMTWLAVIVPSVPAIGYTVIFITPTSSTTATGDEASTHASISETFIYASPDELELGPLRGMSGSAIRSRAAAAAAVLAPAASTTITNGIITLTFDMGTGGLMSYANAATGVSVPLSVDLAFYNGSQSTNYMFTPGPRGEGGTYVLIVCVNISLTTGHEALQVYDLWVTDCGLQPRHEFSVLQG